MVEYIRNGDFHDGTLEHWAPTGAVDVERDTELARHHVALGAESHMIQHWRMDEPHANVYFSLDIKVEDGADVAAGNVQVVFFFSGGGGAPVSATYSIKESSQWENLGLLLNAAGRATSGNIELLVQPGFSKKVTMTNISLMGVEREDKGFKQVGASIL